MPEVAQRTVTYEGIQFSLQENGRDILVHVPTGKQEFSIPVQRWVGLLRDMGLDPQSYFSGSGGA